MKKNQKNRGLIIVILVVFVIMALLPFVAALQATPQTITPTSLEDSIQITPASPEEPVENIIVEDVETSSDPVE
jgi:flagellar basal body-associated protein FliL